MKLESGNAYRIRFSPKELFYKIFAKKRCPLCNGKVQETYCENYQGFEENTHTDFGKYADYHHIYNIKILYKCTNCNKVFTINELVERR